MLRSKRDIEHNAVSATEGHIGHVRDFYFYCWFDEDEGASVPYPNAICDEASIRGSLVATPESQENWGHAGVRPGCDGRHRLADDVSV